MSSQSVGSITISHPFSCSLRVFRHPQLFRHARCPHESSFSRARLHPEDLPKLRPLVGIPELSEARALDAVAAALAGDDAAVSPATALAILGFAVGNCLRYGVAGPLMHYLLICSRPGAVRANVATADIWGRVYDGLETDRGAVLVLLARLRLPTYECGMRFLQRLFHIFVDTHDPAVAEAIADVIAQNDDFMIAPLIRVIADGIRGRAPLLALVIARGLGPKGFAGIAGPALWAALTAHLRTRVAGVVNAIARFVQRLLEFETTFPFDPGFFATVLKVLYAPDTPFAMCKSLILLLAKACARRPILIFLQKRQFGEYLVQLPWRYPADSQDVFEMLEKTGAILQQYYRT
jgi:hypothetical protein